jgi:FkbM family methyltransferase
MPKQLTRWVERLGQRRGDTTHTLDDDAWVLERGPEDRRLLMRRLGREAWILQRPGRLRRQVRRIGPLTLRCHLVVHERAARRDPNALQRELGRYLAREQIAWVLRALGVNCVLDVGANKGQYARMLRRTGYTGRIVSFEPLAHLVDDLRAAAEGDPDWNVVPVALGDVSTQRQINVVPGTMSSMRAVSDFGRQWSDTLRKAHAQRETATIQVRRLDAVFEEAIAGIDDPRVFLKMDTQGYDLETFRGAGETIEAVLGLQSEVASVPIYDDAPGLVEQLTTYEAEGFELAGLFPVSRHLETLRVIEFDAVMVRPGAVLRGS